MKKSLLALAVLGAYAGVATAQSSVTLYGTLDVAGTYVKNDGSKRRYSLANDGINSSQLGFRGVEDLGGGLRAGFNLLAAVNPDEGSVNTTRFFNRRSTASLFSGLGELRVGRDYVPSFWNMTIFDAFGTNGLGSSTNPRQLYNGTRSSNSIGYFLPSNLGGFYGQFMAAAAEGGTTADRPARYLGGRLGFAAGPFDIAGAYSQEKFRINSNITNGAGAAGGGQLVPILAGDNQKTWNVGGSFDFGFGKVLGYYNYDKIPDANEKFFSVSANFPFGQNEFRVGYDRSDLHRNGALLDSKVDQIKATYQYNLSKRTAMYATISRLANKDGTRLSVQTGNTSAVGALPTASDDSKGAQLGVRHFF